MPCTSDAQHTPTFSYNIVYYRALYNDRRQALLQVTTGTTWVPQTHIVTRNIHLEHFCSIRNTKRRVIWSENEGGKTRHCTVHTQCNDVDYCMRLPLKRCFWHHIIPLWPWPLTFWSQHLKLSSPSQNASLCSKFGELPSSTLQNSMLMVFK